MSITTIYEVSIRHSQMEGKLPPGDKSLVNSKLTSHNLDVIQSRVFSPPVKELSICLPQQSGHAQRSCNIPFALEQWVAVSSRMRGHDVPAASNIFVSSLAVSVTRLAAIVESYLNCATSVDSNSRQALAAYKTSHLKQLMSTP
jgi:hypothetical protein